MRNKELNLNRRHLDTGDLAENGAALRRRLHELESLLQLLPVGVAIVRDREAWEMVSNAAFNKMLGISPEMNRCNSGPDGSAL